MRHPGSPCQEPRCIRPSMHPDRSRCDAGLSTRAADLQRGVAVLTAMLVVTLGTMIAVNMMWSASLDQRRASAGLAADQGIAYLHGAEAWAGDILRQDMVDSPQSDHLGETWALELPPLPVDGGAITGRLEDLQGRFNLNNLVTPQGEADPLSQAQFERLLASLGLDPGVAGVVVDWLDADAETHFPNGAEDDAYAAANPPYRTPNWPITSTSELTAMSGIDAEGYRALRPYVTVLPSGTTVNVNTASPPVLASLSDDIDLARAAALAEQRGEIGFADIEGTFGTLVEPDFRGRLNGTSNYFQLTASVVLGTHQFTLYSVLERHPSGLVGAVFRSLGVQ